MDLHLQHGLLFFLFLFVFASYTFSKMDIFKACRVGNLRRVRELKDYVNEQEPGKLGLTPLYIAMLCHNTELVKLLLDLGAKPDKPTKYYNDETPRQFSIRANFYRDLIN
jgi:ankyrin repeat protein